LMSRQHLWASEQGYKTIETSARHDNFAMARLHTNAGFHVIGIRHRAGVPDLIFEKHLP